MSRILAVSALCFLAIGAASASDGWLTSYDDALKESTATSKPVLAYFTGSDWCGWCKKLDKEVLDTPEFEQWASQYAVLLKLDFPKTGAPLPDALKKQNYDLLAKYKVKGFPTVVVLTSDGRQVTTMGYQSGGPQKWVGDMRTKVNAWLKEHGG